jgi:hypothetical protein
LELMPNILLVVVLGDNPISTVHSTQCSLASPEGI